jgi:hypothetical protein
MTTTMIVAIAIINTISRSEYALHHTVKSLAGHCTRMRCQFTRGRVAQAAAGRTDNGVAVSERTM